MKKNRELIEWLYLAEEDLNIAKLTFQHIPKYKEAICYHCQQSVEKYLKAYLVYLDIEFMYKHDLIYLLNLIAGKDKFTDDYYRAAVKLDSFAVQIRYPNTIIKPSQEELNEAIEIAEKFNKLITEKISLID